VILGLTFILLGFVSDGSYALVASRVSRRFTTRDRSHAGTLRRWLPGLTLIGLGVVSAVTGKRPSAA
jgi:threonine/homoserine/homoserine lactone efflux protein